MALYHKDVFWPFGENTLSGLLRLRLSAHAKQRAKQYKVNPPRTIELKKFNVFEIEVEDGFVVKIVGRTKYDQQRDIILAILLKEKEAFVKTLWLNHKGDNHKSLNTSKYERG